MPTTAGEAIQVDLFLKILLTLMYHVQVTR